jgi:outer membrane biosynthesis protein TonB
MAGPDVDRSIHAQLEQRLAERERRRRREWRTRLGASVGGHVVVLALVAFAPAPKARPLPAVVTVDLIAAARPRAAAARPRAAAPKAAEPQPEAVPAPPPPVQKKVVLPREAPKAEAKPQPRKEKKKEPVRPPRRPRPKELDYDDALAKLREELGEPEPEAETVDGPSDAPATDAPTEATGSSGVGVQVSPEVARWVKETIRHVRTTYVTPPEFRGRGLRTCLTVLLTADGRVVGEPRMAGSSGNVFWDDNAVRATLRASPLPAPPEEGDWTFCFPTEESD